MQNILKWSKYREGFLPQSILLIPQSLLMFSCRVNNILRYLSGHLHDLEWLLNKESHASGFCSLVKEHSLCIPADVSLNLCRAFYLYLKKVEAATWREIGFHSQIKSHQKVQIALDMILSRFLQSKTTTMNSWLFV